MLSHFFKPIILAACLLVTSIEARIPLSKNRLPLSVRNEHLSLYQLQSSRRSLFGVLRVRGGEQSDNASDVESDSASDADELSESKADDEEEENQPESDEENAQPDVASMAGPVKLTIKTNLNCPISDQTLEFTASGKRTVESLKQAISKTMRGRPPLQTITLKHSGRTLCNDETVSSILADVDSDDEESDAEDTIGEEEIDKLKLTLDMLPPIDPKFGTEMKEKADSMSTKELLNAYCLNVVGMRLGMELSEAEMEEYEKLIAGSTDEGVDGNEEIESQCEEKSIVNQSLQIRKRAALLQKQMEISFGDETIQLMEQEHERIKAYLAEGAEHASTSEVVYGLVPEAALSQRNRRGRSVRGGATMNIKRVLQRNMNVNWADTTRNSLLFLFFGYFGGRNSFSRTFLLLSAPLCFFLQTRPVKVAIKQAFYAIGEPPGILLSLLPAPQQAIMSLNYVSAMKELYGEDVIRGENWYEDAGFDSNDEDDGMDEYDDMEGYTDSDDEY
ncbi:hypothetical protein ACHAXN_007293 [Cyclotella atomus]